MRCGDARPGRVVGVVSTTSSTGRRRHSRSRARCRRGRARATRDADEGTSTSALTPEQLREKLASVTRRMERARGREGTFESVERANGRAKTLNDDGDDVDASPTTSAREREGDEGDGLARFGDWLSEVGKSFNAAAKASEDDEGSRATVDGDANANADETRASESREKGWFGEKLEPESQGGWFQWTNGWRVSGESIASATSSWIPNRSVNEGASEASFGVTAADRIDATSGSDDEDDAKKEGSQQNFLERVPLPPWIRQRVFGVDDGESSSDDEEADEMGYAATMSEENVDSAIRDANENAASVTSAAVEKLNAALSRIETVEMMMIREGQNATALESLRQSLREARASANAARAASQSLEDAVREVSRAQDALRSENDAEGAVKALDLAKRAVIRQASTSNDAVADALRQVSYLATRVERLGATASDEGAASASKDDGRRDRKGLLGALANARESAQDALVAAELTQTVSRISSFATRRDDGKLKRESREELSAMVKPALQKVVANSLAPVSDDEIGSARLACSLSAWVYYLPQMQHALPRNGLRLVTSSLDAEEIIPTLEFRAGKALMKDSTARAEQALEQAIASARVSANKDARLASLAAKTAADAAQLAADALQLAAELRSAADDDETIEKSRAMALSAKSLAAEALKKFDEANTIAKQNKRKLQKSKMQRELAELESEMQKTLVEQQRQIEANRIRLDRRENAQLPVNFCVAAQDNTATLWVVIEGSTNLASWQAIEARDVAEVFGSQPLTLGTAVAGPWNFTVWVVTRRWGYCYEIP